MQIGSRAEQTARALMGHAIRGELEEFQQKTTGVDEDELRNALVLAVTISAYVALDVCGGQKPTDDDVRKLAGTVASLEKRITLADDDVAAFLTKCGFGGQPIDAGFSPDDAIRLPFAITGNMLAAYRHDDQDWWKYLDQVEAAIEAAPERS